MDRARAVEILKASFSHSNAVPAVDGENYAERLKDEREKLLARVVEPLPVLVRADRLAAKKGPVEGLHPMHLIARDGSKCLYYCARSGHFFLGDGPVDNVGEFTMLGFSSDDALAEWLW